MKAVPWWLLALGAVLLFWAVGAYSRLQRLRAGIPAAFAHLDKQVRRRHDILPKLHATVRPQLPAAHDTLERVLAASSQVVAATDLVKNHPHQSGALHSCSMAEDVFQDSHARLHTLLAEQGDALQGRELDGLLEELLLADNQARFARSLFNQATLAYNSATVLWPTRLLARTFGFGRAAQLQASPSRVEATRSRADTSAAASTTAAAPTP
jgi:LemA protein